jgi:transcriptional regulator with XRE-family HTH domain
MTNPSKESSGLEAVRNRMTDTRDWIDLLERRERAAEAREALNLEADEQGTDLGLALAQARRAVGVSVEELARRSGTSPGLLRRLEESVSEGHSLPLLLKVANALEMDLHVAFQPRH